MGFGLSDESVPECVDAHHHDPPINSPLASCGKMLVYCRKTGWTNTRVVKDLLRPEVFGCHHDGAPAEGLEKLLTKSATM
jgi:hypothetical protein